MRDSLLTRSLLTLGSLVIATACAAGSIGDSGSDTLASYLEGVDRCTAEREACLLAGTPAIDCDTAFDVCMGAAMPPAPAPGGGEGSATPPPPAPAPGGGEGGGTPSPTPAPGGGDDMPVPECAEREAGLAACDAAAATCRAGSASEEDHAGCHDAYADCALEVAPCRYPQACWDEYRDCIELAGPGSSDSNPAVAACGEILFACDLTPPAPGGE